MTRRLVPAVILLPLVVLISVQAHAEAVTIAKDQRYYLFGRDIAYLKDPGGTLTLRDVIAPRHAGGFTASETEALNFSYTPAAYWLRFTLANDSNDRREFILIDDYPLTDDIQLYAPSIDPVRPLKTTGRLHSLYSRDERYRAFAFRLALPPRTERAYYMRVKSDDSLVVRPAVISRDRFSDYANRSNFIFGAYFGLIAAMIIYYLFIFLSTRDVTNLVFALMLTALNFVFHMALNGILPLVLGMDSIFMSRTMISIGISCGAMLGLIFAKIFCRIGKNDRFLNITIYTFMVLEIVGFASSFFVRYLYVIVYCVLVTMGATVVMWATGVLSWRRGFRPALYFLLAWTAIQGGGFFYGLKVLGLYPSTLFSEFGFQVGAALNSILLAFGMGDMVNHYRRGLEENEAKARNRSEYLESAVQSVGDISRRFLEAGDRLDSMGKDFVRLSQDQTRTSDDISDMHAKLLRENEAITQATLDQEEEARRTRESIARLNASQEKLARAGSSVGDNIRVISEASTATEETLKGMTDQMQRIRESGASISGLILIIDDITDRINLLSLNAAIEAARAGEQGKGFAVVADEIGKLATATADNSKEINSRIKTMSEQIAAGMNEVVNTGEILSRTIGLVSNINQSLASVTELIREQSDALAEFMQRVEVSDRIAESIAQSTKKQSDSMKETTEVVDRLAMAAVVLERSNMQIADFTLFLKDKTAELENLIRGIQ